MLLSLPPPLARGACAAPASGRLEVSGTSGTSAVSGPSGGSGASGGFWGLRVHLGLVGFGRLQGFLGPLGFLGLMSHWFYSEAPSSRPPSPGPPSPAPPTEFQNFTFPPSVESDRSILVVFEALGCAKLYVWAKNARTRKKTNMFNLINVSIQINIQNLSERWEEGRV